MEALSPTHTFTQTHLHSHTHTHMHTHHSHAHIHTLTHTKYYIAKICIFEIQNIFSSKLFSESVDGTSLRETEAGGSL